MSRIIWVLIQNSVHQNKNREEVNNRAFVLVQRILNYYPNYPTHRLYFGEVETPYTTISLLGIGLKYNEV